MHWTATREAHPARDAALASVHAVERGAKDEWVALFAPDAVVEDPVGTSPFDPEGRGHHGREGIAAFWDTAIAQASHIEFHIRDSFAAGHEVANVGFIRTFLPDGSSMDAEGVFVYSVGEDGLLRSMRAFWEFERAMTTMRPAEP
ncbi:ketosteroid isomerase-like protein [Halopolyspora algeriensis]|uniref:Ketosteroid isomerase-like protein n=1 Tax=Halopolyspora algeriensis TaxID=1500506 RepID=A0A368VRL7_9ACTN|nr:nuclear transport factor 2 family protein [Halopolyspora algeriensis]RCW44550.1 ketosteroid isomerase-like protein [Halopolyspora algeriensis]TQM55910.1 ketosteroid isomerase-like protein [Halopolyspora algeriensis]